MVKLTKAHLAALREIDRGGVTGPAMGWNADVYLPTPEGPVDGVELIDLCKASMIDCKPIPPPHIEQFDEESGSIVNDHVWFLTAAGRAALRGQE